MNTNLAYDPFEMSLEDFYAFAESKPEYEHWELIDGTPICLASPAVFHQEISAQIFLEFHSYFKNKKCSPLYAPVDVVLFEEDDTRNTVVCQPDLLVYCDKKQNDGKRIHGAPSLVVEIWSDSNDSKYRIKKINLFKGSKVKEIWEVFPEDGLVKISALVDNAYKDISYTFSQQIESVIFSGLSVNFSE